MQLPQKHSATGTTIFTVMSALARQHNAINLSQGFPDFHIDERLSRAMGSATANRLIALLLPVVSNVVCASSAVKVIALPFMQFSAR